MSLPISSGEHNPKSRPGCPVRGWAQVYQPHPVKYGNFEEPKEGFWMNRIGACHEGSQGRT
jgi:hypothetical protein